MGTMLQLEAIGRKPRIRSVHQIHIQRVERGRWLLLVVLCLHVELRRRSERRPRRRNGGRHRLLRAHLQPVETCPAVFGDRQSLTASPSCESSSRVSSPTLILCPPTLPVTESPFSASGWEYGLCISYLILLLFERKKLEYPGEKKNGSLRGEDEINSNETNVTFWWMESKRKKDFVGGLWTVAHSRNFEWLFRILSGDSACRWYYRKWTARFIGEI